MPRWWQFATPNSIHWFSMEWELALGKMQVRGDPSVERVG